MKKFIPILLLFISFTSCEEAELNDNSQAKYTFSVNSWESLGSQTLVLIDASNPSKMDQDINFTISVINKDGKRFVKDTTVHFSKSEKKLDFELLVDTEGEIETVEVIAEG